MSMIVGIKLGNSTFSLAFASEKSEPTVCCDENGDRDIPYNLVLENGRLQMRSPTASGPSELVFNAPWILFDYLCHGNDTNSNLADENIVLERIGEDPKDILQSKITHSRLNFSITVRDLLSLYFIRFKEILKIYGAHHKSTRYVFCVPACWNEIHLSVLKEIANSHEINIIGFVSSPLSWIPTDSDRPFGNCQTFMVIRIGGKTMECSIVHQNSSNLFRVLASNFSHEFGSNWIDQVGIYNLLCDDIIKKYPECDFANPKVIKRIFAGAKNIKHAFTSKASGSSAYIENLYDGNDYSSYFVKGKLDGCLQPFFAKIKTLITSCIQKASLESSLLKIEQIVLAGNGTKYSSLTPYIAGLYPDIPIYQNQESTSSAHAACLHAKMLKEYSSKFPKLEFNDSLHFATSDIFICAQIHPNQPWTLLSGPRVAVPYSNTSEVSVDRKLLDEMSLSLYLSTNPSDKVIQKEIVSITPNLSNLKLFTENLVKIALSLSLNNDGTGVFEVFHKNDNNNNEPLGSASFLVM